MKHLFSIFCLFFLVLTQIGFSQSPVYTAFFKGFQSQYSIFQWTTSNGLPQSSVSGITQTKNRLIWVGTKMGVSSFDGKRFTSLPMVHFGKQLSTEITAIESQGDSLIWTSKRELVVFYKNLILKAFRLPFNEFPVKKIIIKNRGIILIGRQSLYRLTKTGLRSEKLCANPDAITHAILHKNILYWTTKNAPNYLFSKILGSDAFLKKKLLQFDIKNISIINNKITLHTGSSWISLNNLSKKRTAILKNKQTENQTINIYNEGRFAFDYKNGWLHVGSNLNEHLSDSINLNPILYGDDIQSVLIDHVGNIWLGSKSYGLLLLRNYPFEILSTFNGKPVVQSTYVFSDNNGILWFDNNNQETIGYSIINKEVKYSLKGITSTTALEWNSDTLCFFSSDGKHHWFNKSKEQLTPITMLNQSINVSLQRNSKQVLLGSDGFILLWDGDQSTIFKRFKRTTTRCYQILKLGKNWFAFATDEGIYLYNNGKWKYTHLSQRKSSISYLSLFRISQDILLVGTSNSGILKFSLKTGELEAIPKIAPVIANVGSMVRDKHRQLWVGTNSGLVQMSLPSLLRSFDDENQGFATNLFRYEQGIQNVEFNSFSQNKGQVLKDGSLLFSSLGGPVIVRPNSNTSFNNSLANIYIDNVTVNNNKTPWSSDMKSLQINEKEFVRLTFVLPSFSLERVLNFEYRIKGFRDYWTTVTTTVSLDNLPAGNYTVEIRLTSDQRHFSLPVYVKAIHPYRWILVTVAFLIITLLLIWVTSRITRNIQQRKSSLQTLIHQLRLLETEALRSQMNPHFIFNCLNTIQFLFITGNLDRANKYLTDFSSLMRKTMELLREQVTTLNEEISITSLYIELEQLQFDTPFEFRLEQNLSLTPEQISTPTLLFQIFVENAIIHGLKKTKEDHPILTIKLHESEHYYRFHIGDNGPGFSAEPDSIHASRGMKLLRERFDLMYELYDWKIDFDIVQHETIFNDIKTEIIITFDKKTISTKK